MKRTGRPGAPMSLPIKGAPSGAFPTAGTTPCAGRASRGASGPYDLRHAFASLALVHGADIKCVAETMGHKNITMLLSVYQHTLFEQRRRAVNARAGALFGHGRETGQEKTPPARQGGRGGAFFEPAPERRASPPHDAAASWGVAACVLRWNPRGGQDGCRDSGRTAAGRKRGGMSGDSRRGGRFARRPAWPNLL